MNHGRTEQTAPYETRLSQFRVNELQQLLTSFKLQKLGKKNDLYQRCIDLLRNPTYTKAVMDKIREMESSTTHRSTPYQMPVMPQANNNYGQQMYGRPAGGYGGYGMAGGMNGMGAMNQMQLTNMTPRPARNLTAQSLPFYDPIQTILEPQELPPSPNGMKTNASLVVNFTIASEHHHKLNVRENVFPRWEIQLRFFNATGDILNIEQADDFPLNCNVRINESPVNLPSIIPTNKPNVEPKRPSRPVNITQYVLSQARDKLHRMKIDWSADKRTWAVGVYLVSRVDASILRQRVCTSPSYELPYETTEATIRKRLGGDDDDDVAMDSLKISLLCPLGKVRMTIAARSRDCTHIQCFDLDLYLQMNEKRPTWKCCVCSSNAPFHKLIIDKYFMKMLKELGSSVTDVELLKDGGFRVIQEDDVCDISDDDDDCGEVKPRVAAAAAPAASAASSSAAAPAAAAAKQSHNDDIITISDDDDDDLEIRKAIKASMPGAASTTPIKKSGSADASSDDSIIILDDTPPRPTKATAPPSTASSSVSGVSNSNNPAPTSSATLAATVATISAAIQASINAPTSSAAPAATSAAAAATAATSTSTTTSTTTAKPTQTSLVEQNRRNLADMLTQAGHRPSNLQLPTSSNSSSAAAAAGPMSAAVGGGGATSATLAQNIFSWPQQAQPMSAPAVVDPRLAANHWQAQQQQHNQMAMYQQQMMQQAAQHSHQYPGYFGGPGGPGGYGGNGGGPYQSWAGYQLPNGANGAPGGGVIRRPDGPHR